MAAMFLTPVYGTASLAETQMMGGRAVVAHRLPEADR
jgi:hypothetical protein